MKRLLLVCIEWLASRLCLSTKYSSVSPDTRTAGRPATATAVYARETGVNTGKRTCKLLIMK